MLKISSKSINNFLSYLVHKQTHKPTNKPRQKHNLLGGGNKALEIVVPLTSILYVKHLAINHQLKKGSIMALTIHFGYINKKMEVLIHKN